MRFPFFYRTVPNELSLFSGIAQLLKHFGWSWVGILTTDDDSGERALLELKKEIGFIGGCIEFSHVLPIDIRGKSQLESMIDAIEKSTAQVIIVYSTVSSVGQHFMMVKWEEVTNKIWILSEAMSNIAKEVFRTGTGTFKGSLAFSVRKEEITGFRDFLYGVNPYTYPSDQALDSLWQLTLCCKLRNINHFSNKYIETLPFCSGNESLKTTDPSIFDAFHYTFPYSVYRAVYALAHALHDSQLADSTSGGDSAVGILNHDLKPWNIKVC